MSSIYTGAENQEGKSGCRPGPLWGTVLSIKQGDMRVLDPFSKNDNTVLNFNQLDKTIFVLDLLSRLVVL